MSNDEGIEMTSAVVNMADIEALAESVLAPVTWAYYSGGAGDERTLEENQRAWSRRVLRPRVMVDVSSLDLSTVLLGTPVALPAGIAPTALHGLCQAEGERATALAAAARNVLYVYSNLASRPMEDLQDIDGPRWFQLYCHPERAIVVDLLDRAAAAGFTAVVVTADLPVMGRREREIRGGYTWGTPNTYGCFERYVDRYGDAVATGLHHFQVTWSDLEWLRTATDLPLVLKGVMTAEDAAAACDRGIDAVWVSNHGGRQLDRVAATADVLEECVDAVSGRAQVYVDGGVRRGSDVLTAMALGADAVFAGRPWLYALAVDGEAGLTAAIDLFRDELANAMALVGAPTVGAVTRRHVT